MPFHPAISDDELLALVEQSPLAPERAAAVKAALAGDPKLAALLRQLRADAGAVSALSTGPEMLAPFGLVDAVQARLEREALLGLEAASAADSAIPISIVRPVRPSVLTGVLASPWSRRMAAAACLALAGYGVYAGAHAWSAARAERALARGTPARIDAPSDPRGHGPAIATNNAGPTPRPADRMPTGPRGAGEPGEVGIATRTNADETPGTPVENAAARAAAAERAALAAAQLEKLHDDARFAAALTAAREGRLIIRLTARSQGPSTAERESRDALLRRLDALAGARGIAPDAPRFSRLGDADAQPLVAAVRADREQILAARRAARQPLDTPRVPEHAIAGATGGPAPLPPLPARDEPGLNEVPVLDPGAYSAAIVLSEHALRTLAAQLTRFGEHIAFDTAPQPWTAPAALNDPGAVFWWSGAPAGWTVRAQVPIVIELKD
ncbi:hypothetical protein BH11PLA1_BH11PLA1_24310 [soil metagenome]